jgi:tetratricopeptide (TPR) repeat protein
MASASLTKHFAVALWLLPALVLAQPALSGPYRVEPFGPLELSVNGDRLLGLTASGNACNFEGKKPVLEGGFEGSVLIGTLTLCQTGPGCALEEEYPILGLYNAADGSLSTFVRLKAGCQSPAVPKGGRLLLVRDSAPEAPAAGASAGSSASSVARKRARAPDSEAVTKALKEADAFRRAGKYVLAVRRFEAVLSLEENNPVAYHGLGAAQLLSGQWQEAVASLEKARQYGLRHEETEYYLACAYGRVGKKPKGKEALRRAVRLGYPVDAALWEKDADLRNLVGGVSELQAFLKQVRGRKQVESERQDPSDP